VWYPHTTTTHNIQKIIIKTINNNHTASCRLASTFFSAVFSNIKQSKEDNNNMSQKNGADRNDGGGSSAQNANAGQLISEEQEQDASEGNCYAHIPQLVQSNPMSTVSSPYAYVISSGSLINPKNTLQSFVQQPGREDAEARATASDTPAPPPVLQSAGVVINGKNTCQEYPDNAVSPNIGEDHRPPIDEEAAQQPPDDGKARAAAPRALTTYLPFAFGVQITDFVIIDTIADAHPEPALPANAPVAVAPSTSTTELPSTLAVRNADSVSVPLKRRKVVLLLLVLAILLLSAVGVGVYCANGSCAKSGPLILTLTLTTPTVAPATIPSSIATSNRTSSIVAEINNITFSGKTLAYPPSNSPLTLPEELALQWLIESDPLNLLANETESGKFRLRQRYALLTLWFHTIKNPWTNSSGWLALEDECQWFGITCQATDLGTATGFQNTVTVVKLQSNNLDGAIPADLGLLTSLQMFNVMGNHLTGTLPASIGQWTALQLFETSFNSLTGTLPTSLGQWTTLQLFKMYNNGLIGTLPPSIGQWTTLQYFGMVTNLLTGTLPLLIGQWTALQLFNMSYNSLTGTLPASMTNWTRIKTISVGHDNFIGTLPIAVCNVVNLTDVYYSSGLNCTCKQCKLLG
jgi:hypothetical protein